MNGIIFHSKLVSQDCSVEFLFEPQVTVKPMQAIAVFSTGEKAYAEIIREQTSLVNVRIGEYRSGKGKRMSETICQLTYNQNTKSWQVSY